MLYRVFLVEDEYIARSGIRDSVNWKSVGFEFCGEAPDGEIALSMIDACQPDVLITDIKMPHMDGLQLCRIVRERLPWLKIIILTGYDEFEYARKAVALGVTEYLLKPVGVQELHTVLQEMAVKLNQERAQEDDFKKLQDQVKNNLPLLRERFLLNLIVGAISASSEIIEKSRALNLNIIAQWYQVIVVKIELYNRKERFDYDEFQKVEHIVSRLVENNPDIFLLKKDLQEFILIMKGEEAERLAQEGYFLTELMKNKIAGLTECVPIIGVGSVQSRIGAIHHAFLDALTHIDNQLRGVIPDETIAGVNRLELLKLDKNAVEKFLRSGAYTAIDAFFDNHIEPLGETALSSCAIRNYLLVEVMLTTARFIKELGGESEQIAGLAPEELAVAGASLKQTKDLAQKILRNAIAFRDEQMNRRPTALVFEAQTYIQRHYANPDISLNRVAAHVNRSPSHFSTLFSRGAGVDFRDYLTGIRLTKAQELLSTTMLKASEISRQIGYKDPHYFSSIFKKNTGLSPYEFRAQTRAKQKKQ